MKDIKTRDKLNRTIKTLDRATIATDRIKSATVKSKEVVDQTQNVNETSPEEYAINTVADKGKMLVNRASVKFNERGKQSVTETKRNIQRFKEEKAIKSINKKRNNGKYDIKTREDIKTAKPVSKDIKSTDKTVKTTTNVTKGTHSSTKHSVNLSKQTVKSTKQGFEKSANKIKKTVKHTKKIIRGIINGTKALVNAIIAGGWVSIVVIILLCLVGALASSFYGVFFSTETSETGLNITSVISEINNEYDNKIEKIKSKGGYDEVEITGSKANWKDILSVYSVKVTTDENNSMEIATIDEKKKSILSNIFWDMNSIESKIETRTKMEEVITTNEKGEDIKSIKETKIKVLSISISSESVRDMIGKYSFDSQQQDYLKELMSDSNDKLWSSIIYNVGSNGSNIDFSILDFGNEYVNETQKKIVAVATNSNKYGISAKSGYCQAWVADVYQAATGTRGNAHCALCAAEMWSVSSDWSKIQIGATVYGYASNPNGHVGIYIGNGQVIHNLSGNITVQSLESWVNDFKGFSWGCENGIKSLRQF